MRFCAFLDNGWPSGPRGVVEEDATEEGPAELSATGTSVVGDSVTAEASEAGAGASELSSAMVSGSVVVDEHLHDRNEPNFWPRSRATFPRVRLISPLGTVPGPLSPSHDRAVIG